MLIFKNMVQNKKTFEKVMLLVRVIMVINPSAKRLGLEIGFEAPTQKSLSPT